MPFIFQRIEHAWLEYIGDDGTAARADHHGGHGAPKAFVAPAAAAETEAEEEPIREVLPHAASTSAEDATVLLVKSSQAHPHHPHSHPLRGTGPALPHHHIVPRVLTEDTHKLPRHHGVDVGLVEELDADWTDVPAKGQKKNSKAEDSSSKDSNSKQSSSSSSSSSSNTAGKSKQ